MPREGYSSVTIPEPLYKKLRQLAKNKGLSPAKYIETLLFSPEMDPLETEAPLVE